MRLNLISERFNIRFKNQFAEVKNLILEYPACCRK